jgi:hypothetical protein
LIWVASLASIGGGTILALLAMGGKQNLKKPEIQSATSSPDLDTDLLSRCLMMVSKIEAVKEFRQAIAS